MQITGNGAAQTLDLNRKNQARPSSRTASGFDQVMNSELGQKDAVSFSKTAKFSASQANTAQSGVLTASEKSFFNDSFGMNVFDAEAARGPVVSKQGAAILDSQEISFFQNSFGMGSQAGAYTRGGAFGQGQAHAGMSVNRSI